MPNHLLKIKKPYIALNSETYINICHQELQHVNELGMNFIARNYSWSDIKQYIAAKVQYISI